MRPVLERLLYLALGLAAILGALAPFGFERAGPILPNLLFLVTAAWVLRRPESAPLLAVALLALLSDVLIARPFGLHALGLILASEFLRSRAEALRDEMFVLEWLSVGGAYGALWVLMLAGLAVSFTDPPPFGLVLADGLVTVVAYPVVAACLHWGAGIRAARPAERLTRVRRLG